MRWHEEAVVTARRFRRVLVGWDGSADSIEALGAAASIAGGDGDHVVALAVLTPAPAAEVADEGVSARASISRLDEHSGQARLTAPPAPPRADGPHESESGAVLTAPTPHSSPAPVLEAPCRGRWTALAASMPLVVRLVALLVLGLWIPAGLDAVIRHAAAVL
jgi:hypothetical protein